MHGVRGDSGGVPARGPGIYPDLCPPRAPLPPCFHPPETLHFVTEAACGPAQARGPQGAWGGGAATGRVNPPGPAGGTASGGWPPGHLPPMAVAAAPGWRGTLLKALKKNARLANARYAQLATVRPDGAPAK